MIHEQVTSTPRDMGEREKMEQNNREAENLRQKNKDFGESLSIKF